MRTHPVGRSVVWPAAGEAGWSVETRRGRHRIRPVPWGRDAPLAPRRPAFVPAPQGRLGVAISRAMPRTRARTSASSTVSRRRSSITTRPSTSTVRTSAAAAA